MNSADPEFARFYDEDYLLFADALTTQERTENELEFIWSVLGLRKGDRAPDLGFGHGRIANGLALRGAEAKWRHAAQYFFRPLCDAIEKLRAQIEKT